MEQCTCRRVHVGLGWGLDWNKIALDYSCRFICDMRAKVLTRSKLGSALRIFDVCVFLSVFVFLQVFQARLCPGPPARLQHGPEWRLPEPDHWPAVRRRPLRQLSGVHLQSLWQAVGCKQVPNLSAALILKTVSNARLELALFSFASERLILANVEPSPPCSFPSWSETRRNWAQTPSLSWTRPSTPTTGTWWEQRLSVTLLHFPCNASVADDMVTFY